jgi:hypothetical protein
MCSAAAPGEAEALLNRKSRHPIASQSGSPKIQQSTEHSIRNLLEKRPSISPVGSRFEKSGLGSTIIPAVRERDTSPTCLDGCSILGLVLGAGSAGATGNLCT